VAQTKNKRKRKHRGTPAGTVERRVGNSRVKKDAKQIARERREERMNREPTWRGSINRAAIAAAVFGVLLFFLFENDPARSAYLAVLMFFLYIPLGFLTDRAIYNFRQRRQK
jgi:hypothetical protein